MPQEIDFDALVGALTDQYYSAAFQNLGRVVVPGEGEGDNPIAFVIGEAPGAQEEIARRPFVGVSGHVLRDLMVLAGLFATKDAPNGVEPNAWLTNVVKFRPPGNRNPTPSEIKAARPYLRTEWQAVGSPRIIIPVGSVALTTIVGKPTGILKHSGRLHEQTSNVDGKPLYVWPMIHPSFGLRNEAMRPIMEKDWLALGEWMDEQNH